jgi:hypothetical protein
MSNLKKYLLREGNETFTIEVASKTAALFACEMYNAEIVKEIKS